MSRLYVSLCFALVLGCNDAATNPTVLVTNMAGRPLTVVIYDYSVPVNGPPGIYLSPEFALGTVGGSGSACLRFADIKVSHAFALIGEDTVGGVQTPATGTFVPQDSPGWTVTFTSVTARPTGPTKVATGCIATP